MNSLTPADLQQTLAPWLPAPRVWVAFSGGLDSTVLLHLLTTTPECESGSSPSLVLSPPRPALPLAAIHVDHGLHPDSSGWADHCRQACAVLGVPLMVRRLNLRRRPGTSLEALAREGRYAILRELAGPGDLVLTAQHRDDQAETLLLALLRGSGVKGLAAMPRIAPLGQGRLLRPLLDHSRPDLLAWAQARGLRWLEDPSNSDLGFDRNFLRARVLPLLAERWPACAASLARSAAHCAEAQGLIEGLAAAELAHLGGSRPGTLSVRQLTVLETALLAAVLRHWITGLGLPPPDSRHLGRIRDELLAARPDRQPLVAWPGAEARRYRDDLYVMPPLPAPFALATSPAPPPPVLTWLRGELLLPAGLGRLRLAEREAGVRLDPEALWPGGLEVRFTGEGLSCWPFGRDHHRRLKQLFQEAGIPPWLRPYIPRLFAEGRLIAVGDRWRCKPVTAAVPDADWRLVWQGGIREHQGFGFAFPPPPDQPPVTGGKIASSSPSATGVWGADSS